MPRVRVIHAVLHYALSQRLRDACVFSIPSFLSQVAAAFSLNSFGVSIKKNFEFEEGDAQYIPSDGELTGDALENFVTANKMPLFIPFSQDNADLIFESGLEQQLMFIADDETLTSDAFEPFKKVCGFVIPCQIITKADVIPWLKRVSTAYRFCYPLPSRSKVVAGWITRYSR
jgi:hypothetical protein